MIGRQSLEPLPGGSPTPDRATHAPAPRPISSAAPVPHCPTIAVVGSGPSGCYVAQALAKKWPNSEITVFESLPAPYGLIRYGVAADHQGTKGVTRQFDRLFTRDGVRFAGNVTVGRDIDFARVAACFDIIVLATGLPEDRALDVPRDPEARVVGAGALLRALNGFPHRVLDRDPAGRCAPLGRRIVVVGMGNVAIDVLRLLSKGPAAFAGSDIDDNLLGQLRPAPPRSIDAIARSSASSAKCDPAMLRELVALPNVDLAVSGLDDRDDGPVVDLLRRCAASRSSVLDATRTRVTLHFRADPERLTTRCGRTVLSARCAGADERSVEFVADTVITAIGFTHGDPLDGGNPGQDWTGEHVYRVGWLSRGARGTIPQNRKDAQAVARTVIEDVDSGRIEARKPGFRGIERLISHRVVGFDDWQRIEAFERRTAQPDRCRRKVTDLEQMLALATGHMATWTDQQVHRSLTV